MADNVETTLPPPSTPCSTSTTSSPAIVNVVEFTVLSQAVLRKMSREKLKDYFEELVCYYLFLLFILTTLLINRQIACQLPLSSVQWFVLYNTGFQGVSDTNAILAHKNAQAIDDVDFNKYHASVRIVVGKFYSSN